MHLGAFLDKNTFKRNCVYAGGCNNRLQGKLILFINPFPYPVERFRKAFGSKVSEIMTTEVVTASPEETVREVATLMADRNVNRLPVTENGRLVGIVTRGDIVRAIAQQRT